MAKTTHRIDVVSRQTLVNNYHTLSFDNHAVYEIQCRYRPFSVFRHLNQLDNLVR